MKNLFFLVIFFSVCILSAHAQPGSVTPVIIYMDGGGGPIGGGGTSGNGAVMNGYEPQEERPGIRTIDDPRLPLMQIVSKNGKLYVITGQDVNGVWVVSAREVRQPAQDFSNLNFTTKSLGSRNEAISDKVAFSSDCTRWIETEEAKIGINGGVKGEAGTIMAKGSIGVEANRTDTKSRQVERSKCNYYQQ